MIAGGGIAAVETALALRALGVAATDVTLLAPNDELRYRPLAVAEPFGHPSRRYRLDTICADLGIELRHDSLSAVDVATHTLTTGAGEQVGYGALVVATGARPHPTLPHTHTFFADTSADSLHTVLRDIEEGMTQRIAFVVPTGAGWSLPLYELALMTAARAHDMGIDALTLTLVTPEDVPLAAFRGAASDAVGTLLEQAGIDVLTSTYARDYDGRVLQLAPGSRSLPAERVVALPALAGPALAGLPCDADGFVHVDEQGHVVQAPDVFAVGDATTFPLKQGGIAAQQADVVAALIARSLGLSAALPRTRPLLRAVLLTGDEPLYLRATITGGESVSSLASRRCPWWPPHKIAARHLAPYLADCEPRCLIA